MVKRSCCGILLQGGGFKHVLFSPLFGEDSHFDEHIFQRGWFNHQLGWIEFYEVCWILGALHSWFLLIFLHILFWCLIVLIVDGGLCPFSVPSYMRKTYVNSIISQFSSLTIGLAFRYSFTLLIFFPVALSLEAYHLAWNLWKYEMGHNFGRKPVLEFA